MEEILSRLVKNGINILDVTDKYIKFEFRWRPVPGKEVWSKTAVVRGDGNLSDEYGRIVSLVSEIRVEVEQ